MNLLNFQNLYFPCQGAGVGAGVPSMAGAGDGASTGDELDAFKLKMAEMNFQKAKRIAELEVQQKEDTVKLDVQQKEHAAKLELQQKENMAKLELQQKELELQQERGKLRLPNGCFHPLILLFKARMSILVFLALGYRYFVFLFFSFFFFSGG